MLTLFHSACGFARPSQSFVWRAVAMLTVIMASTAGSAVSADDGVVARFVIPDVEARPGESVRITVQGDSTHGYQGFSLSASFPAEAIDLDRFHYEDTILEAIENDFFEVTVEPDEGWFTVGALVETTPPFEASVIPAIGQPVDLFHIETTVSADAADDFQIELVDGFGQPPVPNVFVVESLPVPVADLAAVTVDIPWEDVALFLRGDATSDSLRDVSDPISILNYKFFGHERPQCIDAADANDDGFVDISDAIFLLSFLFDGGMAPPMPVIEIGSDPTDDGLDCESPPATERRLRP
ncbi:MAG: hypothetical protein AAF517_19095 [Planctomycetota bacterium]